jgi:hypothetical protein
MNAVAKFERIVGKKMSLVEFGIPFVQCDPDCHDFSFPTPQMQAIRSHGSIPVVSWGSETIPAGRAPNPRLAAIASGRYDAYIREFATAAAAWGQPFFLRFDWEMNGTWFPWSYGVDGNTPARYVAAWRRVHDIFVAAGATNATWVWCPYAHYKDKKPSIRSFYPGSKYVDWSCMDGYNWGRNSVNPQPWTSFGRLFDSIYGQLTGQIAPGKPVMVAEFASSTAGGNKASWIKSMFATLPRQFPAVRALVWFDSVDRGLDWPIETSAPARKAFSRGIGSKAYAGNRFAQLSPGPVLPLR